jgi:hypothetical protein
VREYENSSYSIVFLGHFNPAIFSPLWFGTHGLFTEDEVNAAQIFMIHPEIARFTAGGITLQVEATRFVATATSSAIQLHDLVARTFRDFLNHTPIRSMGINREVHFKLKSQEARIELGRKLAPLAPWGEWGDVLGQQPVELTSGMISLSMRQVKKLDSYGGFIQTTIQPSSLIPRPVGVFLQVNDHYELSPALEVMGADKMLDILDAEFEKSLTQSEWIIDQVLKMAGE